MSRGAEGGTKNYVVFDDKLISIAKKYGVSMAAASAIVAGTMTPEQAQAETMSGKFLNKRLNRSSGREKNQVRKDIAKDPSFIEKAFAMGEVGSNVAANMGIGLVEDSLSGWKKILTGDANASVDLPDYPMEVRTPLGKKYAQNVGEFIAPAAEVVGRFSNEWSDEGAEYSPFVGAARKTLFETPIIGDALTIGGGLYQAGKENYQSVTDEVRALRAENEKLKGNW